MPSCLVMAMDLYHLQPWLSKFFPIPPFSFFRGATNRFPSVGKLIVACIQQPSASEDKILIVNSFTATPNEILAEFEKQTNAKWEVSYTSLEKLKEVEKQAWEAGAQYATHATLRRIWTEGGTLYSKPRDNGLVGEPPMESLADQVRQVIAAQTRS